MKVSPLRHRRSRRGPPAGGPVLLLATAVTFCLVHAGCENPSSSLCDSGQILDPTTGYCVAAPVADAGHDASAHGGQTDSGPEGGAQGDGGCSQGTSALGDSCTSLADCHCPTDYCALMPGATTGFCTRTGCDSDPSICPSPYTCFDLSAFQAGLPHICFK